VRTRGPARDTQRVADEAGRERSWWQTLPGAVTALAGLVTAITGLLVALNQLGVWDEDSPTLTTVATSGAPATTDGETTTGGEPRLHRVVFPRGSKATLGGV
jgi:hypothetical protein